MAKPLRSQPTRDRILAEARRLFAEEGFERATIRAIGTAAGVNPSMVIRYFGAKENLFATAAAIDFRMPDLTKVAVEVRGEALARHVLERWDSGDELTALLRAAATHESARRRFTELVEQQAAVEIIRVLPEERQAERLALIVMQIAGLVLSRYLLRHPAVTALAHETLVREVGGGFQRLMS